MLFTTLLVVIAVIFTGGGIGCANRALQEMPTENSRLTAAQVKLIRSEITHIRFANKTSVILAILIGLAHLLYAASR